MMRVNALSVKALIKVNLCSLQQNDSFLNYVELIEKLRKITYLALVGHFMITIPSCENLNLLFFFHSDQAIISITKITRYSFFEMIKNAATKNSNPAIELINKPK